MKTGARAVIIKDGKLLLMKRFKLDREYYTLPGGDVEKGETPDQTVIREIKEETSIECGNPKLVFVEDAGSVFGVQHVFTCDYKAGEPLLPPESEEAFWSTPGKNTYEPMWFPMDKLNDIPFVSPLLKQALLMAFSSGFPTEPYHFSSRHAERLS